MKSHECTIGRRVALLGEALPLKKGTIVGPVAPHQTAGEVVPVEWDNGVSQKVTPRSLLSKEEFEEKERVLYERATVLALNYKSQIRDNMVLAAKLITDAANLAKNYKQELSDMDDMVAPLIKALSVAGWEVG